MIIYTSSSLYYLYVRIRVTKIFNEDSNFTFKRVNEPMMKLSKSYPYNFSWKQLFLIFFTLKCIDLRICQCVWDTSVFYCQFQSIDLLFFLFYQKTDIRSVIKKNKMACAKTQEIEMSLCNMFCVAVSNLVASSCADVVPLFKVCGPSGASVSVFALMHSTVHTSVKQTRLLCLWCSQLYIWI